MILARYVPYDPLDIQNEDHIFVRRKKGSRRIREKKSSKYLISKSIRKEEARKGIAHPFVLKLDFSVEYTGNIPSGKVCCGEKFGWTLKIELDEIQFREKMRCNLRSYMVFTPT